MSDKVTEFAKAAKAVVALILAGATAALAYPDLIPVHGTLKAALTTAAVFITGIAVWIKKNAKEIEDDAQKVEDKLTGFGIKSPDLSAWATEVLDTLGADQPDVTPAPSSVSTDVFDSIEASA